MCGMVCVLYPQTSNQQPDFLRLSTDAPLSPRSPKLLRTQTVDTNRVEVCTCVMYLANAGTCRGHSHGVHRFLEHACNNIACVCPLSPAPMDQAR